MRVPLQIVQRLRSEAPSAPELPLIFWRWSSKHDLAALDFKVLPDIFRMLRFELKEDMVPNHTGEFVPKGESGRVHRKKQGG